MAVPLLLITLGFNRGEDGRWLIYVLGGGVIALVVGVLTWMFTRYRFTPEQLQLRTGLFSRRVLTAPLDRIRSVDIESTPIHRVLGLAKVRVGTGVDSRQIELDGLTQEQAAVLRVELLRRSQEVDHPAATAQEGSPQDTSETVRPPADEQLLARIDWSWLRFAPFSLGSLVVVAGVAGVLFQFGDDLPVDEVGLVREAWAWAVAQALLVLVAGTVLLVAVGWTLLSTASYVLNWWNLRLVREANTNIRLSRGLLTTRSQTLERAKVRGVSMGEPFLLRFVRGAELSALATGVGLGGTVKVLPPAPRAVVQSVGHELLEESGPLTMDLTGHGPRARRRIHVSQQWGSLITAALVAVPTYVLDFWWFATWPWWLPLAVLGGLALLNVLIAESAWRNLGHGLTRDHLVVQTGAVVRTRAALERAGIIGWVVHQNFFQRRLGLADLIATTAAGGESLVAPNIPLELAADLADRATPGMLDGLLA
ncbi:PH domain-containing protein [Ornithinimicrobium pratense]|uniref:PH domain-containing protein n=1 Tax=Ornithinimicrobium pratense TaxID=2593973 RepID=UPI00178868D8|nr:PH domain-containing protein [Ornithinimicrobium pratense]